MCEDHELMIMSEHPETMPSHAAMIRQKTVTTYFSSVQSNDQLGPRGDMRADSVKILIQYFLQNAFVSSSGMGRDVHSLLLSIQHFLCQPPYCPSFCVR